MVRLWSRVRKRETSSGKKKERVQVREPRIVFFLFYCFTFEEVAQYWNVTDAFKGMCTWTLQYSVQHPQNELLSTSTSKVQSSLKSQNTNLWHWMKTRIRLKPLLTQVLSGRGDISKASNSCTPIGPTAEESLPVLSTGRNMLQKWFLSYIAEDERTDTEESNRENLWRWFQEDLIRGTLAYQ